MNNEKYATRMIKDLKLSDEEWAAYRERVLELGRQRKRILGDNFHEIDFLVGALLAYELFGGWGQQPTWVYLILAGQSPLDESEEETA